MMQVTAVWNAACAGGGFCRSRRAAKRRVMRKPPPRPGKKSVSDDFHLWHSGRQTHVGSDFKDNRVARMTEKAGGTPTGAATMGKALRPATQLVHGATMRTPFG